MSDEEINPLNSSALEELLHIVVAGKAVLVRSSEIKEVVRPVALTAVPMGPQHLLGLANIHGQIVCIIDAGGVTSLPESDRALTPRTRFLILRHPSMHVGIWVDQVCGMERLQCDVLGDIQAVAVVPIEVEHKSYDLLQCSMLLH